MRERVPTAIRIGPRAGLVIAMAAFIGLVAFFWPFSLDPNSSIAYLPGLPFTEQWQRYIAFDLATSLGWDTGRAVTNFVCVLIAGPAVLVTFRRAARRARFRAPVNFHADRATEKGA